MLPNPGFELGTDWAFVGNAAYSTEQAHAGARSCRFVTTEGFGGSIAVGRATNAVAAAVGDTVDVAVWVYLSSAGADFASCRLIAEWNDGAGWVGLGSHAFDQLATDTWQLVEFSAFVALDVSHGLRFRTSKTASGGIASATIYLDDVGVEITAGDDAVRPNGTEIFAALLEELRDITLATGFDFEFAKVYPAPVSKTTMVYPAAVIVPPAGGRVEPEEVGQNFEDVDEFFGVAIAVMSADPFGDCVKARDAIRQALNRAPTDGGLVRAVTGVIDARVVDWDPDLTEEAIASSLAIYHLTVQIRYSCDYSVP